MKTIIKYEINCSAPRLSDEEVDPLEADDIDGLSSNKNTEGWLPWSYDDLIDVRRIIEERMQEKQRIVIEAFLCGQNNRDIQVSEKFWRYHFAKGIEFIKEELKL